MRKIVFTPEALSSLQKYKSGNQKLLFKILELLEDIQNTPFQGVGKPEPLKGSFQGFWSRRINDEHRLVYRVTQETVDVVSCFGHYV